LSYKISLGFALILVLAVALGSLALWNMKKVEKLSVQLDQEYVPEVAVANNVERYSLEAMFEMRGYGLSMEKGYLDAGNKNLSEVKKYLEEAKQLASRYPDLPQFKEQIGLIEGKLKEYEQLVNQTIIKNEMIANLRKAMDEAAGKFIKNVIDYSNTLRKEMTQEIESSSTPEKLLSSFSRIESINKIVQSGNSGRVANFKFQATGDIKLVDEAMKNFTAIDRMLEELKAVTVIEQTRKNLDEISAAAAAYKKAMQDFVADWQALQEVNKTSGAAGIQMVQLARKTALAGMEQTDESATTAAVALSSASNILMIGLGIALLIGICMTYLVVMSITRPIRLVVDGLSEGAAQVASAAGQMAGSSQQLAEGASEQAASIEETSSSLEEMSSMTRQNAENADHANRLMLDVRRVGGKANESIARLTASMREISNASKETSKIIKTIDEIAFQTNLLALNAAVEAARAGEAGAGFAVVADEVRNLATRAAEAAKNTANLIEDTVKKVNEGSELVQQTSSDFAQVGASAARIREVIAEISAASTEQAQGIEQINRAVSEMDKVVQQNASNAEESAASAEEMNAQAENMKAFVDNLVALMDGTSAKKVAGRGKEQGVTFTVSRSRTSQPALLRSDTTGGLTAKQHKGNGTSTTCQQNPEHLIPFSDDDGTDSF
jgi:methyl-accepting chemotaxis protein